MSWSQVPAGDIHILDRYSALTVSMPLFAAASAHYNSASPQVPRLILLDEAFAGVDDDSRAKSLGLLATFDLDVVMTSEREWASYPQVPGLSIAQLSRVEGVDAVGGVTLWRREGRRRHRAGEVDGMAHAGAPPRFHLTIRHCSDDPRTAGRADDRGDRGPCRTGPAFGGRRDGLARR